MDFSCYKIQIPANMRPRAVRAHTPVGVRAQLDLVLSLYAFTRKTTPDRAAKWYAIESASTTLGGSAVVVSSVGASVSGAFVATLLTVLAASQMSWVSSPPPTPCGSVQACMPVYTAAWFWNSPTSAQVIPRHGYNDSTLALSSAKPS